MNLWNLIWAIRTPRINLSIKSIFERRGLGYVVKWKFWNSLICSLIWRSRLGSGFCRFSEANMAGWQPLWRPKHELMSLINFETILFGIFQFLELQNKSQATTAHFSPFLRLKISFALFNFIFWSVKRNRMGW